MKYTQNDIILEPNLTIRLWVPVMSHMAPTTNKHGIIVKTPIYGLETGMRCHVLTRLCLHAHDGAWCFNVGKWTCMYVCMYVYAVMFMWVCEHLRTCTYAYVCLCRHVYHCGSIQESSLRPKNTNCRTCCGQCLPPRCPGMLRDMMENEGQYASCLKPM